jgi:eukaryotic-like serine/threonine-protein kinase
MNPDRWDAVGRLYHAALARPVDERAAFLAEACADDEELRREVQSLLTQASAGGGLTGGAVAAAAGLVTDVGHSVLAGRRLGAYQILAPLGAGGMGEVYRARDTRLGRDVAIKILPRAFTADASRLARFEREARVLASLNHPHIAAIYGFEEGPAEAGPIKALILELVEGETLAERIARAGGPKGPPLRHGNAERNFSDGRSGGPSGPPMPIKEALDIARQIADALDAAHEKGIVHRDLKPANIKITPQGVVKVLDFGLAKLDAGPAGAAGEAGGDVVSEAPTITVDDTREGLIVGTAAYMSPEQARGHAVDKRTDVWAFGCVLYEMLAGHAAFSGATLSDTIAALIDRTPDWSLLPTATPSTVRRLLERSLRKDQRERLRDIGDVRTELTDALHGLGAGGTRVSKVTRIALAAAVVAGLIAAVGYIVYGGLSRSNASASSTVQPIFSQLTSSPGIEWFPSMSPDGKWVIYAGDTAGNRDIYLQSVTGTTPINLTKDSPDDDDEPAFSPDGEQIAFRSTRDGGGIFVMGRTGEAVRRVTRTGFNPSWSPDGKQIAFTTEDIDINPQNGRGPSELFVVNVDTAQQKTLNVRAAILAHWSPHGGRIAYSIRSPIGNEEIWTVPVAGGEPALVISGSGAYWNPSWSPDGRFIYFSSDRGGSMNLWRIPIDEDSGRTRGDPQPLATPAPWAAHASASADGTRLAYSSVLQTTNVQRLSFDPVTASVRGEEGWVTTGSRVWSAPDPSPDKQWVTFYSRLVPEGDVYIARSDGTGLRQLTSDAALDRQPRWSPDGNWIAFFSNRGGPYNVWKIHPDGSDLQQMTEIGGGAYIAWSPDGSAMATSRAPSGSVTWLAYIFNATRLWKEQTPRMLPPFEPPNGLFIVNSWSPNGEYLAGTAGLDEKGVVIYSLRTNRYERLTDYGEWPVWLPDSRRLLFVSRGREFHVIDLQTKQARKIYSSSRDVLGPPQLSRDGRAMYFTRRVTESDIWAATFK